jgi:hypothetical protein
MRGKARDEVGAGARAEAGVEVGAGARVEVGAEAGVGADAKTKTAMRIETKTMITTAVGVERKKLKKRVKDAALANHGLRDIAVTPDTRPEMSLEARLPRGCST